MIAATLTSAALDSVAGQASPISVAQSNDLEQASPQARAVSTDLRPQKQEYFKDRATIVISAYQGVAGLAAIAGTVAVIAGVLLKDPYIITMGLGCILLGGGGFVLAGKYRQLKSQNQIFDDMLAENGRLKGQVHFFEDQNKSLEQSNSHLKGQVGELSNKVVALQQTVTRFDQENDELRQSNEQLSDQIGELTEKVKELLQNVRRFDEENEELKSSNSLLKGHVTNLESMSGRFEVSVGEMVKNEQSFKILRDQYQRLQEQFIQAQEKEIAHDIERQRIDGVRQEKEEQMLEREEEGIRQLQLIAQKEELLLSREEEIMKGLSFLHQKESALKAQEEKIVKSLTDFALERGDLMRLRAIISKLRELNPQLVSNVEEQLVSFVDVPKDFLA